MEAAQLSPEPEFGIEDLARKCLAMGLIDRFMKGDGHVVITCEATQYRLSNEDACAFMETILREGRRPCP